MPTFSAKTPHLKSRPMDVVFVVYPDIVLLDLVGPLQVFSHARNDDLSAAAYRTSVVSLHGGNIATNTILEIGTDPVRKWAGKAIHTLVVVGGDGAIGAARDPVIINKVAQLAGQSKRICSVCSGALVLAAAGLLDGRRAVTHWEDCERLAEDYPDVKVEVDPIYIRDGDVWTSAGITAGIDMALAIVAEDHGRAAAIEMARSLVTQMVRSGGQSQFSPALDRQARDCAQQFGELHNWINDNLDQVFSVDDLAHRCAMSSRNFYRRYKQVMGVGPAKAVETIRVDAAREMLEATVLSIKEVAAQCGFGSDETMRRAFLRNIRVSPSQYKEKFQNIELVPKSGP